MELELSIVEYSFNHVPYKIKWINDPIVNKYLHYDLPIDDLNERQWLTKALDDDSRHDYVIEVIKDSIKIPVGLIGLINTDKLHRKAEFYILIGNHDYYNKGVARLASEKFLKEIFKSLELDRIYLYTEVENTNAQKLFERIGFMREGLLRSDLIYKGISINRYIYSLLAKDFFDS